MASIFESNLDEFFMIRVGGLTELADLKTQPIDNKSNQTPAEQVSAIYQSLPAMLKEHDETVHQIEAELSKVGIERVGWKSYTADDRVKIEKFFNEVVGPVASPQIIGSRHPFPNLRNKVLYTVFNLTGSEDAEMGLLGLVEVPPALPRVVELKKGDHSFRYTLLEDIILACADTLFDGYATSERATIRVTRNMDIDPDEGSFDMEDLYSG